MSMIIDGTNGLTFNNATTQASAGIILQVVNVSSTSYLGSSSATWASSGISASITPKFSTSKIFIICTFFLYTQAAGSAKTTIYRSSTNLGNSTNGFGELTLGSSPGAMLGFGSMSFLDSPATTSSTTYTIYGQNANGSGSIQVGDPSRPSQITLMEVAG